jgi:Mg-chelatase subunit ChlD
MKKLIILAIPMVLIIVGLASITMEPSQSRSQAPSQSVISTSNSASSPVSSQVELKPNWAAISKWPSESSNEAEDTEALKVVDPWQVTTIIVLDDSGSMEARIDQAKAAVIQAVSQFPPESMVGVISLNSGVVSEVVPAAKASALLPQQLGKVSARGGTPLGVRLDDAAKILAKEAGQQRGFGVFRILVTTDGAASDNDRLKQAVSKILSKTPIELATIGIGIGKGHALNVPGFTSYVSVDGVEGLASALAAAAAEQTNFQPIGSFEE